MRRLSAPHTRYFGGHWRLHRFMGRLIIDAIHRGDPITYMCKANRGFPLAGSPFYAASWEKE